MTVDQAGRASVSCNQVKNEQLRNIYRRNSIRLFVMSNRGLLSWFEKRRQSRTLNLAQIQIIKVFDTVTELDRAVSLFPEDPSGAGKCIERLFVYEVEIDQLRRAIFAELTKGTLPTKYREDLKALVGRLDLLADHVKDAARSINILMQAESVVPQEFIDIFSRMTTNLVECTAFLRTSIEALGDDPSKAVQSARKVDEVEGRIDEDHLHAKISFITSSAKVNAPTYMVLKDLADSIEHAADMCADTADFLLILAAGEE
jgi:predicted phosphate transport protein (TIGR00153 family)